MLSIAERHHCYCRQNCRDVAGDLNGESDVTRGLSPSKTRKAKTYQCHDREVVVTVKPFQNHASYIKPSAYKHRARRGDCPTGGNDRWPLVLTSPSIGGYIGATRHGRQSSCCLKRQCGLEPDRWNCGIISACLGSEIARRFETDVIAPSPSPTRPLGRVG